MDVYTHITIAFANNNISICMRLSYADQNKKKVKVNQLMVPLLYGQASEIWRCRTMAAVSLVMIHTMIYWIRLHIY